jgi:hypothetical protein
VARHVQVVRIDAQTCARETFDAMQHETDAAGLQPITIVNDVDRLAWFARGAWVEWTNEPDGDIPPDAYRADLDRACDAARALGLVLWAPALSNLDGDSLLWLNLVRDAGQGWPDGLAGISVHRYGDGTFETPHPGFSSREAEVRWLKTACAGLPFIVTEFGYPTIDGLTEQQQAERISQEWQFWTEQGADAAFVFQLNDGPTGHREHHYGIRRFDGTWKPSADTFPAPAQELDMFTATFAISRRHCMPHPSKPGYFTARYPIHADTVLSVQPDGTIQTRPAGTHGSYEEFRMEGNHAVFPDVAGVVFAILLVE